MLSNIIKIAISPILYAIFSLFWGIFISFPFLILQGLFKAARFFGFELINIIIFKAEPGDYSFKLSNLPIAFLAFLIYALAFTIVFILISFAKYHVRKRKNGNTEHLRFKNVLRQSMAAFLWALLLPFLIFVINIVLSIVFEYFGKVLELQTNKNFDIAESLYVALNNNASWAINSVQNHQFLPMPYIEYLSQSISSSMSIGLIFIKNTVVAWMCVIFLGAILVDIVKNSLIQFTLFIISPLVAAKSIDDNGIAIVKWKNSFTKSSISIFISLLSLHFFVVFILILSPAKEKLNNLGTAVGLVADLIIYIGAAYSVKSTNKLISYLLGIELSDFSFKKAGQFIKRTVGFGKQAAIAGAAVATGGATLGATLSKGGFANTLGGLIGKASNLSKVSANKNLAKSLGMSNNFIKSSFSNVGSNQPLKQRRMLDIYKKAATDLKTGTINKKALNDYESLKKYNNYQINYQKEMLKKNKSIDSNLDNKWALFGEQELKQIHLKNKIQQNEYKQKIADLENNLKLLNNYDENINNSNDEK
ncbi:hypothetical protein DMC14_002555 [Metamycoplasma phocicerebrale]|uniref:Transmembrane protein n=1 Tax=Metamycoplasma phocicerebrale TaxID=142649 RepID=A0A3T0TU60_9BACT|nr:hypothetical protein [Metamycoplasma phocicerebrale]AZZ65651.1 hypothetical protein DMC14_002555 [Metamycoplasma phocicerebrale]